jgi:hypothetical protein
VGVLVRVGKRVEVAVGVSDGRGEAGTVEVEAGVGAGAQEARRIAIPKIKP